MQELTQVVPTQTFLQICWAQALWIYNHWSIVLSGAAGVWKLSRSIKQIPGKINAPVFVRMDAHDKLDNERELKLRGEISQSRNLTDEHLGAMRISIDQLNAMIVSLIKGQSFGD